LEETGYYIAYILYILRILLGNVYTLFGVTIRNDVYIIKRLKINRLRWAGHVIRRENEEITKRMMLVKPEGIGRKVDQE
jgi:hypothetical protein